MACWLGGPRAYTEMSFFQFESNRVLTMHTLVGTILAKILTSGKRESVSQQFSMGFDEQWAR